MILFAVLLATVHQSFQKINLPNWNSIPGVHPLPSVDSILHPNVSTADIVSKVTATKDDLVSKVPDLNPLHYVPEMPDMNPLHYVPEIPDLNPLHYVPEMPDLNPWHYLPNISQPQSKNYTPDPSIVEDGRLTVPELIAKYGYNSEIHHVTTEDGYILELHRIAGSPKSPPKKGKKVVFLMHGFSVSSASFTLTGPSHGLAFRLADEGFDVWLGNNRGNLYSTNHTTLKPFGSRSDQNKYWYFTWHHIGFYDLPASIDYALATTEQEKLQFIGHSQGVAEFFVLMSERPEYNDKIEMMHGLGPVAFLSNVDKLSMRGITSFMPMLTQTNRMVRFNYLPAKKQNKTLQKKPRKLNKYEKMFQQIERKSMKFIMGSLATQLNETFGPAISGHVPAGAGLFVFIHLGQLIQSGRFQQFDYGTIRNLIEYHQMSPPQYNLKNVTAPVAIYYAEKDWLTTVKDVRKLMNELPNVAHEFLITADDFSHNDFIYGARAPEIVYDEVVKNMKAVYGDDAQFNENVEESTLTTSPSTTEEHADLQ